MGSARHAGVTPRHIVVCSGSEALLAVKVRGLIIIARLLSYLPAPEMDDNHLFNPRVFSFWIFVSVLIVICLARQPLFPCCRIYRPTHSRLCFGLGLTLTAHLIFSFLADRTINGRAIGTVLRPSVVCVCGIYCGKTVRPRAKVTIESQVVYEKSIGTKINDLALRLFRLVRIKVMHCQPLRDIRR